MVDAPPVRNSAQWATENRIMPPSAPIPGKFDASRNPYIMPIAEAAADHRYGRVSAVMGTQMGKSVGFENIVGHRFDDDPVPVLYVAPTSSMIDSTIEPKIMDMIEQSPSLARKYDKNKSTKYVKYIGGVKFRFAWAGSPSELAADSAGLILVDEVDRIVNTKEGDTTEIIEARGDAYVDSKVLYTATPTTARVERSSINVDTGLSCWEVVTQSERLHSKIWALWQSGTRHEWAVECPDCSSHFIPWSGLLTWAGRDDDTMVVDPMVAEKTARLACPCCGVVIEDKYRRQMNRAAVAVAPGQSIEYGQVVGTTITEGNKHYSLWVSGLFSFSAKKSLGYCAARLCAAINSGDPAILLGVYNTVFGECYMETGEVPSWQEIKACCWQYRLETLGDVLALLPTPDMVLMTVDVQMRRLVYSIRAWWPGFSSMLLESGELFGETDQPEVWADLSELADKTFAGYAIDETGIDGGYRPDSVCEYVDNHKGRARVLRGDKLKVAFRAMRIEVDNRGKTKKIGLQRWDFDSSRGKAWVHSRIKRDINKPGFWLLPLDVDEEYLKQIVGEEFDEKTLTWKQVGENHWLDCEAMQHMLAKMRGMGRRNQGYTVLDDFREALAEQRLAPPLPSVLSPVPAVNQHPEPVDDDNGWLGAEDDWI